MTTNFDEMTVAELKALLKERGLPVSGKKADLIERLSEAPVQDEAVEEEVEEATVMDVEEVYEEDADEEGDEDVDDDDGFDDDDDFFEDWDEEE
ncbi:MAG TPA: SAP domain-containing protein, partial [Candidatus Poseidoniales archaeon]|nr:SAP domain-containing protein [Candidatus Poseidoniales archaeon]